MKVLSTTICYPTPSRPTQGVFIRRRLEALAQRAEVRVVCPIPWFPGYTDGIPPDLPDAKVPVHYIRMPYLPGMLKTLDASFFAMALQRCLKSLRKTYPFDLIDAHFVWPDGVGASLAAWKLGVPVVVTVRGKLVSQINYSLRRRRIVHMLRSVDGRVAVSQSLTNLIAQVAGSHLDTRVIPNGIDTETFKPADPASARHALGLPDTPRYIVSVGQIREIKGFDRLVDVLPEVRRRCGDVRLILIGPSAGETTYERPLRQCIDRAGLNDIVTLAGSKTPEEISRYLAAADVFALATRSEGWCNAIQEALAVGVPVVTTDVGGNREIIRSEELGILVPFGHPTALTEALIQSLHRQWDRQAIASVGAARSWSQVAAETLAFFEEVLSRRSNQGRPIP